MTKLIEKLKPKEDSFLEVFKYKDLLFELVAMNIKLKYRRSFLGYVWSILNPLLIMTIMTVVFSFLFKRGLEYFPIYLLAGRTVFEFVNQATSKSINSITENTTLLKKTHVSKFIFPLANVTATMIDFIFSLGALIIVMLILSIFHGKCLFSLLNFGFIITIFQTYLFALGLGFLLSSLHVFFRDIRYIYNAFITMILYCSAIFYDVGMFYEKGHAQALAGGVPYASYLALIIEHFNPIYIYMKQFRYFVWTPTLETIPTWAAVNTGDFVLGFVYAIIMLVIGIHFFKKKQDKFILYI